MQENDDGSRKAAKNLKNLLQQKLSENNSKNAFNLTPSKYATKESSLQKSVQFDNDRDDLRGAEYYSEGFSRNQVGSVGDQSKTHLTSGNSAQAKSFSENRHNKTVNTFKEQHNPIGMADEQQTRYLPLESVNKSHDIHQSDLHSKPNSQSEREQLYNSKNLSELPQWAVYQIMKQKDIKNPNDRSAYQQLPKLPLNPHESSGFVQDQKIFSDDRETAANFSSSRHLSSERPKVPRDPQQTDRAQSPVKSSRIYNPHNSLSEKDSIEQEKPQRWADQNILTQNKITPRNQVPTQQSHREDVSNAYFSQRTGEKNHSLDKYSNNFTPSRSDKQNMISQSKVEKAGIQLANQEQDSPSDYYFPQNTKNDRSEKALPSDFQLDQDLFTRINSHESNLESARFGKEMPKPSNPTIQNTMNNATTSKGEHRNELDFSKLRQLLEMKGQSRISNHDGKHYPCKLALIRCF